jgi:arylsulfatase
MAGQRRKPIYFDSIDNSAYILGKAPHSAGTSWVYIDGESLNGVRADIGGDSTNQSSSIRASRDTQAEPRQI